MVGPGLFFALTLALLSPVRAERTVGLDAQGIDPLTALSNPQQLDVRDELGRPVSARQVAAELKQAQVEAAREAAYASTLPQAAAVAALLEMLEALRLAWRSGAAGEIPQRLFALAPTPRPHEKPVLVVLVALVCAASLGALSARPALACPDSPASKPLVLRC